MIPSSLIILLSTLGLVAFACCLSACSTSPSFLILEHKYDVTTSTVTWIDKTPPACSGKTYPAEANLQGCAAWSLYTLGDNTCVILMRRDSPDELVAHEFHRCFGWVDR